jgi:ElaA protein
LVVTSLHAASPRELSLVEAYPILRLRVDVFVVEQECPYPELDGRDLEPTAIWLWATEETGAVTATLRVLTDDDGRARIGRVATAAAARSNGTASELLRYALDSLSAERAVTLDAQSQLEGWYARFGFVRSGNEYVEDGIPHIPMTLEARL